MVTSFFCITSHMTQLFNECVEKKNYEEFYNHYRSDFEELSEKLKTVADLPKNTMLKYYAHNFMDCFELLQNPNGQSVGDSIITPFHRSIKNAINNKNWISFYRDHCHLADFVMRKARNQKIIDIYVVEGANKYLSFYDRDWYVAKKKHGLYQSKNNGIKLLRTPPIYQKNHEADKVFETSSTSRNDNSMAHHGEPVHFTCSTVSHQRPYEYPLSSRYVPMNQSYRNSRSIHLDYLQSLRKSTISGDLKACGCNDTSAYVQSIEQSEDDESVNETDQYCVPPKQVSRFNVQLDNQKNSKEAKVDSDSLYSPWSIVSLPREDMDTLKPFELDNTLRQSSEEMDIFDVPVPEIEQPQSSMLGDLWSDLNKPEPLQKPAEDIKQQTTNAFIDTEPLEPKISEKEYSEDEDKNVTMNKDFQKKFQDQTDYERFQDELKRKKEERAEIKRKLEKELRKLDLEDKEKLVMASNFKTPGQESGPISAPLLNPDVIENDSLDQVLQNTLRSTDTESSGKRSYQETEERGEVNFITLLQEQALRQQENTEKMKKNKAEVLNRTCATLETSGLVALKRHAGEVEHQPNVNTAEISRQEPIGKESLFTQKDLMLKNVNQEGNEKLSTDNMKTEQIAPGESSERFPIFSELLSDLDPVPAPISKNEKTPCLEDFQLYVDNISKQTTESMTNVTAAANELLQNDLKNGKTSESKLPAIEQHDSEGEEKEAQERLNRSVQTQSIRQQEEFEVKRKEWADRKKKLEEDTDSIRKRTQKRLISFLNGLKK